MLEGVQLRDARNVSVHLYCWSSSNTVPLRNFKGLVVDFERRKVLVHVMVSVLYRDREMLHVQLIHARTLVQSSKRLVQ